MRIGVIADTHIPDRAQSIPEQILRDFKNTDMIIHAGDLVELNVLDKLRAICPDVKAVWGNMDSYEVREKLSEKEIIELPECRIGVMHGFGAPRMLIDLVRYSFKNNGVNIIIFGHSHIATSERKKDILYFNPGSPTDTIFSPYNSYGIIEINGKAIEARIVRINSHL